jgi:MFS family permease
MALFSKDIFRDKRRWWPLVIILIITVTASVNRQLVSLTIQPVKVEFGLSDTKIGALFSIVGVAIALVGPFIGQMVDRLDRHRLMLAAIIVWSIATAAFGLAGGYIALTVSLAVLASAETTLGPVCNSLIAGKFRGDDRINANLVYFAAGGLTTGVGIYIGGLLLHWSGGGLAAALFGPATKDWRIAMMLAAIAGVPLALLTLGLGKDTRPKSSKSATDISDLKAYLRDHWAALVSFNLANAGYFVAATAVLTWVPIYIVRHFGITPAELGMRIGVVVGIADVLGILIGLIAIKKFYARLGPIAPRYIFQVSLILIAVVGLLQLMATNIETMLVLFGIQNCIATFGTASFNNMVQDMSSPDIRGKIFGINAMIFSIVSIPGPLLVGIISDYLGDVPQGLLWATIMVSIPALLCSVLVFSLTNRSFLRTVQAMALLDREVRI